MAEPVLSVRTYVVVGVVLIALTVGTVAFSFAPVPQLWHVVVGLATAVTKGSLVVLFVMHALAGSRLTWGVIAVTCFWVGLRVVLTYTDYFSRGLLPGMPGH